MSRREDSHAEVVRLLEAAYREAGANWCDLVRQDTEQRLGLDVGDDVVINDAEYGAALDAFRAIRTTLHTVRRLGTHPCEENPRC